MNVISEKLKIAKHLVIEEFGDDAVAAIIRVGSITNEASDLDVSVIYYDRAYNEQIEDFRDKLNEIADKINREQPQHPITLWASKEDHYRTNLPDISYVKRNLPYMFDRLDAWGGLAKNTLASYEIASHQIIYGHCDALLIDKKIAPYEAVELFLIATRTFAEGIIELASTDIVEQRNGSNHIAKAGLRAAYAALLSENTHPLNSYSEILEAAILAFPNDLHPVLQYLYELKTGMGDRANILTNFLPEILKLLHYCENRVSTVRRLSMIGVTQASAGESLAFGNLMEELTNDPPAQSEDYCRCPSFDVNYIHSLYFSITAFEIVRRFVRADIDDPNLLNFFFEEIFVVATFAFYLPFGFKIQLGRTEAIDLWISIVLEQGIDKIVEERDKLFSYILSLEQFYQSLTQCTSTPWLSHQRRLAALNHLFLCASIATAREDIDIVSHTIPNEQDQNIDGFASTLRWQSRLFRQTYDENILKAFNHSALMLYQAQRNDDARAILQDLLWVHHDDRNPYPTPLKHEKLLSITRQYLGVTYHRSGDTELAKIEYTKSLDLDPDNFSALDDLTSLLMLTEPNEATVKILSELVERSVNCRKESKQQVSHRFMVHAIKCKQKSNYSNAETWYKHAIDFDPNSFKAHFNYGLLLEKVGKKELAIKKYKKAIELNSQYKNACINLALLQENRGNARDSIDLLNSLINFGLADEQVWTNLGNSYLKVEDLKSADKSFVEALKINDNYANALNGRGGVLAGSANPSQRDLKDACIFFRQAINSDSSFDEAKMNLNKTLSRKKLCKKSK
jgi:tetratricopeptide (TPR) repeat protein